MTPEEFQNLIPTLRPKLVAQATRYLKDSDEAEDIVQDAMLKLWLLRPQLIGNGEAFAHVLVRNLSLNRLRRKHMSRSLDDIEQAVLKTYGTDEQTTMGTSETEEQVAQLMSLVEKLPERQRIVLRLHDLEGMDYDEISQLTGTPVTALRQTVSRTRRHLRLRYLAVVSAVVAVLLVCVIGHRAFQNYQFSRRFEGSYIIVDGKRNDNLRQIRPQIESTLAAASNMETAHQEFVRQAEADVLQAIGDPEERRRLEQLLIE